MQISRPAVGAQRERASAGLQVAFLGFFERGDVFVAWDPEYVLTSLEGGKVSMYARHSQHAQAMASGAAVYSFTPGGEAQERCTIAMPSEALGFYLENIAAIHRLADGGGDVAGAVAGYLRQASEARQPGEVEVGEVGGEGARQRLAYTRTSFRRNPRFARRVHQAYGGACCVCGKQLDIVEAAHIIPHAEEGSTDEVANGLALCAEHHALYDTGLLLPRPGGLLWLNPDRAEFLRATGQAQGLEEVARYDGGRYRVPEDPALRPRDEYLARGVAIRVGE